jgi:hypothetical protein
LNRLTEAQMVRHHLALQRREWNTEVSRYVHRGNVLSVVAEAVLGLLCGHAGRQRRRRVRAVVRSAMRSRRRRARRM